MALTIEKIREIVAREGYRVVNDETSSEDAPRAWRYAEARSPRIEDLQRIYGCSENKPAAITRTGLTGTGAIVMVEPAHGGGRPKAMVLSEEGEILGEQG